MHMDQHLLLWQQTPAGLVWSDSVALLLLTVNCHRALSAAFAEKRFSVRAVSRGLSHPAQSSGLIRDSMHHWHRIGVNMTTDLHCNVRGFHTGENRLSRLAYLYFRLNACSLEDRLGG